MNQKVVWQNSSSTWTFLHWSQSLVHQAFCRPLPAANTSQTSGAHSRNPQQHNNVVPWCLDRSDVLLWCAGWHLVPAVTENTDNWLHNAFSHTVIKDMLQFIHKHNKNMCIFFVICIFYATCKNFWKTGKIWPKLHNLSHFVGITSKIMFSLPLLRDHLSFKTILSRWSYQRGFTALWFRNTNCLFLWNGYDINHAYFTSCERPPFI